MLTIADPLPLIKIIPVYRAFRLFGLLFCSENDVRATVIEMGNNPVILNLFLRFPNIANQDFNIRAHFVGETQIISLPVNSWQQPQMTFCPTCGIFHNLLS